MKKLLPLLILLAAGYYAWTEVGPQTGPAPEARTTPALGDSVITRAYENRQSDLQVRGEGVVTRVLSDDNDGSRHQRFILELDGGHTVLVAHNIDLAPRVSGIAVGDTVEFFGEYEWNDRGGVIHWTHHDPAGQHVAGWVKHRGSTYQ